MSITQIPCRAVVNAGGLSVETPFVLSFNVRKQRGQVGTFDASLKVLSSEIGGSSAGGDVQIYGQGNLIFTGICRQAKISPCFDDPAYVILTISGADALSLLHGKKYTRRCRSSQAVWVGITGVVREGLRSGKFIFNQQSLFTTTGGGSEANTKTTPTGSSHVSPPMALPGVSSESRTVALALTILNNETISA